MRVSGAFIDQDINIMRGNDNTPNTRRIPGKKSHAKSHAIQRAGKEMLDGIVNIH